MHCSFKFSPKSLHVQPFLFVPHSHSKSLYTCLGNAPFKKWLKNTDDCDNRLQGYNQCGCRPRKVWSVAALQEKPQPLSHIKAAQQDAQINPCVKQPGRRAFHKQPHQNWWEVNTQEVLKAEVAASFTQKCNFTTCYKCLEILWQGNSLYISWFLMFINRKGGSWNHNKNNNYFVSSLSLWQHFSG